MTWIFVEFISSFISTSLIDYFEYKRGTLNTLSYPVMLVTLGITGYILSFFLHPSSVLIACLGYLLEKILLKEVILK